MGASIFEPAEPDDATPLAVSAKPLVLFNKFVSILNNSILIKLSKNKSWWYFFFDSSFTSMHCMDIVSVKDVTWEISVSFVLNSFRKFRRSYGTFRSDSAEKFANYWGIKFHERSVTREVSRISRKRL